MTYTPNELLLAAAVRDLAVSAWHASRPEGLSEEAEREWNRLNPVVNFVGVAFDELKRISAAIQKHSSGLTSSP